MSAEAMLHLWGLRIAGGTLRPVGIRPGSGDEVGIDEVLVIVRYVESTEGFDHAREALLWVYSRGRSPEEFPLVGPGQTLGSALLRRGWGMYLGKPRRRVAELVVDAFVRQLELRLLRDPLVRPVERLFR